MADLISADKALAGLIAEIDHVTDAELIEIGHFAATMVVLRTKKGIDADGKPFVPYSAGYIEERVDAGLKPSPVDLARTGHMLGAMVPERTGRDEVTVLFNSPLEAKKAAAHNYGVDKTVTRKGKPSHMREPRREFLDVRMPKEVDAIAEVIEQSIASRIEKSIK